MATHKSRRYSRCMATTKLERTNRRIWVFAVLYSLTIMGLGLWVTSASGEWIAIVCATGLVILPIRAIGWRTDRRRQAL